MEENKPSSSPSSTQNEETDLHGQPNLVTTDQARVDHQRYEYDLNDLPSNQSENATPSASHQIIPQIAPGAGNFLVQPNPMLGLHSRHGFISAVDPSLNPAVPLYSSNAPQSILQGSLQRPISGPNYMMGTFPPNQGTEYFAHRPTRCGLALPPARFWPGIRPEFRLENLQYLQNALLQQIINPLFPPHQRMGIVHQGAAGLYQQQMGNPTLQIGSNVLSAPCPGRESQMGQQGGIYPGAAGLYPDFTHCPAVQPALPSDSDKLKMPSVAREKKRIDPYLTQTNYTEKKDPGFCVLCERRVPQTFNHKKGSHSTSALYAYSIFQSCSEPTHICAPVDVEDGNEVSQCPTCKGIFYNHRVDKRNHNCIELPDVKSIDQGKGSEYCLLCQLRCENVEQHWQRVHKRNKSYTIGPLGETRIKTLYPKNIDRSLELRYEYCPSEGCETCPLVTFFTRLRRSCAGSRT